MDGHRNTVMATVTDTRTGATALTAKDFEKVVHYVFMLWRRPRRF